MVSAIALKSIKQNNEVIGYKLRDNTGKEMDIKCEAIIDALNKNLISIDNLKIIDNKLVMIDNAKTEHTKTDAITPVKEEVTTEKSEKVHIDKEVHSENNTEYNKIDRMHELVEKLNLARKVYEQGTDEIMTNFEYDKLYDELVELESELGTVLNNSPTINVGYEVVSNLPKEAHNTKMLSLSKTKDRPDLVSFLNGHEGVMSWKLDGLTVVLTYDNGKLTKAVTRGNGEIGEVVTNNALTFKNLPRIIPFTGHLVLRGEAIIKYSTFDRINAALGPNEEKYKNPRNLCSGSVRQLDSSITAQRDVNWVAFELVECSSESTPNNVDERLKWLKDLGFSVVNNIVVTPSNVLKAVQKFEELVKTNDFPSDGLVLTYRDKRYGDSLGQTAKAPRHSIAFKWQDEEAVSTMIDIDWQVGRTGVITPVAIFEPVDIEGSTVERASLHNLSILTELMAQPFVRQKIKVFKANMIIPQISWAEFVEEPSNPIFIPGTCPCCGENTSVHEDPNSGVLTLWCDNPDCSAKGNRLFEHFVTRDAMNIDGISGATLNTLSECGIITDLASIFHLAEHQNEITSLEGFGFKSYYNMVQAVEKARKVKLYNLIYALGIPNIGLATSKLICRYFGNDMKATVTASYNDLINIDGIGDVIAQSFVDYFANKENAEQFVRLIKEVDLIHEEISTDTSMAGITICVTGDVYIFPNRRAIKDIVESMGGKLTGSVSRSTNYLVTNDTTSGSRKNKAAQEYGIPILTEQEFIDKFSITV